MRRGDVNYMGNDHLPFGVPMDCVVLSKGHWRSEERESVV